MTKFSVAGGLDHLANQTGKNRSVLSFLLKPLGRILEKRKWETDRKYEGLWIGPPPKLLSSSDLLAGDVVFCGRGNRRKLGDVIRTVTAGEYVHCALYIGNGHLVDVTSDAGCRRRTLDEFLEAYAYLAVSRCPGNEDNRMRRSALIRFARTACRGAVSGYSRQGATLVTFRELADMGRMRHLSAPVRATSQKKKGARKMFCSEFVLEAHVAAGYIRRDDPCLAADRRTPTGLAEENVFEPIGYMSKAGLAGVSQGDTFLAGCGWVLGDADNTKCPWNETSTGVRTHFSARTHIFRSLRGDDQVPAPEKLAQPPKPI